MADYAYSIPSTPPSTPGSLHKRYEYGVSKERFIKRSTEHVVTTGIHVGKGPDGSLPQRLEIRELEKDKLMWTLPYLVFYEQVLHGLVQEIAAMFPEGEVRDNYTTAAEKFRIPYWDWAAPPPPGEDVFPESVVISFNLWIRNSSQIYPNEAWIPESNMGEFDSLESIHDQVHGFTGGGGHMSYIDYSAFDPLFMLHHTMVDRCFAIWQVINPDSYVEPMPAQFASYTVPVGSIVDMHTPLQPFYNSSGGFWDSSSIRSTETFGYVYPETASNGTGIDKALVINAINRLYGPDTTDSELPIRADAQIRDTAHTYEYQEWIANILVRKHALSGPFFIHLFLGPIDPDPKNWSTSKSLIEELEV
ncbi:putative Tyrosinase [Glarea lozoyensis 74030]|uniref:Putative Tyrosinase n=1 Tax=Glarea lozoyensis (strain ATCC 74030 / MF5533) TaxID=1104152 RepID=H0EW86_GLAL7|nr:putative Tyrosinase [Glarea lozoyensis 74030]